MRINKFIVFALLVTNMVFSQIVPPYQFTRIKPNKCEDKVKVVDNRPASCTYASVLYPVLIENFDYKEDLPNNFGFNMSYTLDDDYGMDGDFNIWSGPDLEAYYNNLSVSNGKCYLTLKKELNSNKYPFPSSGPKSYPFTFADLRTLFNTKGGIFTCNMKLPENNLLWPAYWLREGKAEIDIFEFYDGNVTQFGCDVYHSMRMTAHKDVTDSDRCSRGRKFPVNTNFFNQSHKYQLTWTNYKYEIFLDNIPVGYATKFYDGIFQIDDICNKAGNGVPNKSYWCTSMSNLTGCNITNPINGNCILYNKVHKDLSFIEDNTPMEVFISCSIFKQVQRDMLVNSWNNYSDINKRIEVDQFVIWQPINCTAAQNVYTQTDFKNITGNTNFLSGNKITVGGGSSPFDSWPAPGVMTTKENFQFLAIDEITFLDDVIINEGAYLRAEIINCNGVPLAQKNSETNSYPSYAEISEEELRVIEDRRIDSLIKTDLNYAESLIKYNSEKNQIEHFSLVDNNAISLFPNPTKEFLIIDMHEEDYNDISSIEIIDLLGRKQSIDKSDKIDVKDLKSGLYQIKFTFTFGHIVVKTFIKE